METVNDAITSALLQLFKSKLYIPLYPFKTIVQCVLRDEAAEGISQEIIDYATIPSEEMHLQIKMVLFGDSTFVGTKHLVKLVSANSVKELKPIAQLIQKVFGNQVQNYKTDRIEANYIDVFLVTSCLSLTLIKPMQHRLDMVVEVVIKGTLDECMNLFIRRILEDAHMSETSNFIITSKLTVTIRGTVEDINVYSMRERRQQVINALKSAVFDEGDVILECLVRTERQLLSYEPHCSKAVESSEGFTRVRRSYKLSCIDNSDKEHPAVRCFSRNPLESVALGMFSGLKEADLYLKCLSDHLRRMKPRSTVAGNKKEEVDPEIISSENATQLLNDLVNTLCGDVVQRLDRGELAESSVSMLLVLGLLTCNSSHISHAMEQVRKITHSPVLHLTSVRDAARNLEESIRLLVELVQQSPAVLSQLRGNALSPVETAQINKIHSVYSAFGPAIKQLRYLLLELFCLNQYSELQYLAPHIMNSLWELFDPVTKSQPVLAEHQLSRGVSSHVATMQRCEGILHRLNCMLQMVELTIGTELFVSTIKHDLLSYKSFSRNTNVGLVNLVSRNINTMYQVSSDSSSSSNNVSMLHTYQDLPKCFSDLVGYAKERVLYAQQHSKRVHDGDYSELTWRPSAISKVLRMQLLPEENKHSIKHTIVGADGKRNKHTDAADRRSLLVNTEEGIEQIDQLWDFYALLGEYNVSRLGGVDTKAIIQQEWDLYDSPRFMCVEAAKLRYLQDIQVLPAVQRGLFEALVARKASNPLQVLSKSLFEYPSKVGLFTNLSDLTIADFVLQPVRRDRLICEPSAPTHSGLYKIPFTPPSTTEHPNRLQIAGGVLGSDRVLSALGAHVDRVFVNLWNLPALCLAPPASRPGLHIKLYCGVALSTAVHWCAPHTHALRAIQEQQDRNRASLAQSSESEVDHHLIPTPMLVEKKKIFTNFLGKKNNKNNSTDADSTIRNNRMSGEEYEPEIIDYCASEDEEGEEEILSSDKDNATAAAAAMASPEETNSNSARHSSIDLDTGVLRSRGCIELEVVIKIDYESAGALEQVRSVFGKEIGNCLRYLQESHDWKPTRVLVHREGEKTENIGNRSGEKVSSFHCSDLDAKSDNSGWTAMEECVSQYGSCIVETGVSMPDCDSALRKEELLRLFEKIMYPNRTDRHARVSDKGASAGNANYFSADFKDSPRGGNKTPAQSPRSPRSPRSKGNSYSRGGGGAQNKAPASNSAAATESTGAMKENQASAHNNKSEEDGNGLDPSCSDLDRLCSDSYVRKLLHAAMVVNVKGGGQRVRCYVPCRIRFTLLAQLAPRMSWGNALRTAKAPAAASGSQNPKVGRDLYSPIIGLQANPLSIGEDHTVARLLASTLWVSPEAARNVWSCAKDGEAQCILHESIQRHRAYHQCVDRGDICRAYEHALVGSVLTQNYAISVSLFRALNGAAFKLKRLIDTVEVCRHILSAESAASSFEAVALGATLSRYVCLGYRYLITSPQVAHLRGGCAYLLKIIGRLEALLQLAPIPIKAAAGGLPTSLDSPHAPIATQKSNGLNSAAKNASQPSATPATTMKPSAPVPTSVPLKVKPDDEDFESALSGNATTRAQRAAAAAPRVVLAAPPPPLLAEGEEGLRRVVPFNNAPTESPLHAPIHVGTHDKLTNIGESGGEAALRRALSHPDSVREAVAALFDLEDLSRALWHTLCDDLHSNFPDLHAHMCAQQGDKSQQDSIPSAMLGLGVKRIAAAGNSESPYPHMVTSADCLDSVLGRDGSIEALVSFIQRAETPINTQLDDPDFAKNIKNVALLKRFKMATTVLLNRNNDSADRHVKLRQVVELGKGLNKGEKTILKDIVRAAAISSRLMRDAKTDTGKEEAPASQRFKAGADIVNLLLASAHNEKQGVSAEPGIREDASTESLTLGQSDSSASVGSQSRRRLSSAVRALAKGSENKGVAALFKKLHVQLKDVAAAEIAHQDGLNGPSAAVSPTESRPAGGGDSLTDLRRRSKEGAGPMDSQSKSADANAEMNDIKSLLDAMFEKKPDAEPNLSLAPSFASLGSASSGTSIGTNSGYFGSVGNHNSTVHAEAEAFYRAPVSAPLSRFHDEKIHQAGDNERDTAVGAFSKRGLPTVLERADSEQDEDIMLSGMLPASHTRGAASTNPTAGAPTTGVRVFETATLRANGSVSMLGLLRQCMSEEESTTSDHPDRAARQQSAQSHFPSPGRGAFAALYSHPQAHSSQPSEPLVESGGMLQSLRNQAKPDHQRPRDVYF